MRARIGIVGVMLGAAAACVVIARLAAAQAISYETASEVTVTCGATGTDVALTAKQNYIVKAATEHSWLFLNKGADAGTCNTGGTEIFVGVPELIKAKKPSQAVTISGTLASCCRSSGGTGTLTFTPVRIEAQ